jgi:fucose permease
MLLAFALLGIGNTIIQVSLNPLLSNVVSPEKLSGNLTMGQFIKSVASFTGPIAAAFLQNSLVAGNYFSRLMPPLLCYPHCGSQVRFYIVSSIAALIAFVGLTFVSGEYALYVLIAFAGFACANMFSIIFSFALKSMPQKSNEISGLMIMGVSGGALFPWLMGVASDSVEAQWGAVTILILCCGYQLFLSLFCRKKIIGLQ